MSARAFARTGSAVDVTLPAAASAKTFTPPAGLPAFEETGCASGSRIVEFVVIADGW
jgi:hypothetical protein